MMTSVREKATLCVGKIRRVYPLTSQLVRKQRIRQDAEVSINHNTHTSDNEYAGKYENLQVV